MTLWCKVRRVKTLYSSKGSPSIYYIKHTVPLEPVCVALQQAVSFTLYKIWREREIQLQHTEYDPPIK